MMYKKQYKVVKSILTNVVNGYSRNELLRQKDNLNKYIEYCAENKHINKNNKVKNNIKETLILLELVNNALQYKDVVQTQNANNAPSENIKSTLEGEIKPSKSKNKEGKG